jgi:ADP-ribose pyrophosphatase YjhB (NUDIX family)
MNDIVLKLWRLLKGKPQWYLLWIINSKFMIGVSGVILDEQGRILLLRHRFWMHDVWGLPGGYVIKRERLEDALSREVREETGYLIQTTSLIRIVSGYRLRLEASYRGKIIGGVEQLDKREIIAAHFFNIDELPERIMRSHREIIRLALNDPEAEATIKKS